MSTTVDSRVVEMRFDNQQFESGIRESLNSLQQLKDALEKNITGETFDSLDKAARNVDLSGIQSGIDALTDRFSTLGIVGMTVIQNITNAITNTLGNAIHNVYDSIVSGGLRRAQNIENARFQLQGILKDTEKVKEVMDNASESVDGTAYSLDAAAKAASQLAASGVQAGDQMTNVLRGIAGVAATTSSDYEGVSRIFTQIAGQGRLMGDQLLQLSSRGLNAAATLKDYFNEVAYGGKEASDAVKQQIAALTGVQGLVSNIEEDIEGGTEAIQKSYDEAKKIADKVYKERQKEFSEEYQNLQEIYNEEYKALQKKLGNEYNLKKKAYDEEYKALQKSLNAEYEAKKKSYDEEYKQLQKSLSEEVEAVQEANSKRLEEVQESYEQDVEAYRKATEERISLINEEYRESIKLIDEEKYEKLKAVDDQIKAIQDQAKAEQKALKDTANQEKRDYLENAMLKAKGSVTQQKAAQALAEFEAELAREQLADERAQQIEDLRNQRTEINDEAQRKKEEARQKAESEREAIQEEANAELKAMQKAHQENLKEIRKEQAEQLEALRESNAERLEALRESQSNELEIYREGQNSQLEALREKQGDELEVYKEGQNAQLEALRERQNEQLSILKERQTEELETLREIQNEELNGIKEYEKAMKESSGKADKWAAKFGGAMEITEADIRDMVSQGLISFDLFSEAMAETFGEHAYDANKTFQGALSNIKSALARTGQMFFLPLIQEGSPLIDLLNAIRIKVNEVNKVLAPIAEVVTNAINEWIPKLTDKINNFRLAISFTIENARRGNETVIKFTDLGNTLLSILRSLGNILVAVASYIKPVVDAFKEVFTIDTGNLRENAESFEDFTKNLKASEGVTKEIRDLFKGLFTILKNGVDIVIKLLKAFSPLTKIFSSLSIDIGGVGKSIADTIIQFAIWLTTSEKVQKVFETITKWVDIFVDKVIGIKSAVQGSFQNAFFGFDIGKYFTEGFFKGMTSLIPDVLKRVWNFGKELLQSLRDVLKIHSPSEETESDGINFIKGFIEGLAETASLAIEAAINVFTAVVDAVKDFFASIDFGDIILNFMKGATDLIDKFGRAISDGIPGVISNIGELFAKIKEATSSDDSGENAGKEFISSFIRGMKDMATSLYENTKLIFTTLFESIKEQLRDFSLKDAVEHGKEIVKNFAESVINTVKEWMGPVGEAFAGIFGNITPEGLLTVGAGITIIIAIIKLAKSLKAVISPITQFNSLIKGLTKTLKAFSMDLRATAILKMAAAIGILVGSFVLMYKLLGEDVDWLKFIGVTFVIGSLIAAIGFIFIKVAELGAISDSATSALGHITKGIKSMMRAEAISTVIETVVSSMTNIALAIVGLTVLYTQYGDELKNAANIFTIIAASVVGVIVVFAMISGYIDKGTEGFKNSGLGFLSIAAALYLIILSINKVVNMNVNWKAHRTTLLAVAVIFGILLVVIRSLVKTNNQLEKDKGALNASLIIGLAVLVLVTLSALKKLIKMGAGIFKNASQLTMIAVIFAMMVGVIWALKKVTDTEKSAGILKLGGTLFGICAFLLTTVAVIGLLSLMPIVSYIKGVLMLSGLFLALKIACESAGKVTSGNGWKSILAISAVAAALIVAMGAFSMIDGPSLITAGATLFAILMSLSKVLEAAGSIGKDNKSLGPMIVMIVGIAAIGAAIWFLQDIPWQNMLSTAASIGGVLLAMAECIKIMQNAPAFDFKKDGPKYLAGLLLLAVVGCGLSYLSTGVKWDSIISLAGSIAIALLAMAECIKLVQSSDSFGDGDGYKYIVGVLLILAVGGILKLLSESVQWDSILSLAGSIAIALTAMGACIKIVQDSPPFDIKKDALKYVTGLITVLAIGMILKLLSDDIQWESLLGLAGGIAAVLVAMGVCLGIVCDNSTTWKSVATSAALLAEGVAAVGGIGYILNKASAGTNWEATLGMGLAIAVVLVAMTMVMAIAAVVGNFAGPAAAGIGLLDLFIADLALVLYALGEVGSDPRVSKIIANGGEVLGMIGEAIGGFVGSIISGALSKISDSFPKIGENLSRFMDGAGPFFEGLKGLDANTAAAAGSLAKIILALGAAEIMDGIGNLLSKFTGKQDMKSFGEKLADFGKSITNFANNTKDVNGWNLKNVADATLTLIEMAKAIPNEGGWLGKIMGENDIEVFGKKLVPFSKSLAEVDNNFKNVKDLRRFKDISDSMNSVITMATSIPNSGGWLGGVLGENDIDMFGAKLVSFSVSLAMVSNNLKYVGDLTKFNDISKAMTVVGKMAKDLPNSGGWFDSILGKNDIDDFGYKLESLSKSIAAVSKNLNSGVDAMTGLNRLQIYIPIVKNIADKLDEDFGSYKAKKLDIFLEDLNQFITTITTTCMLIGLVNAKNLDNFTVTISTVAKIKDQFEKEFGDYKSKRLDTFLEDLNSFVNSLASISFKASGITINSIITLRMASSEIVGMRGVLEKLGDGYKAKKLNDFLNDLNSYVVSIVRISLVNTDTLSKLMELPKTADIIADIANTFKTSFDDYKAKNLSRFLDDLKLYATVISSIQSLITVVETSVFYDLYTASLALVDIKSEFDSLNSYKSKNLNDFLVDFKNFTKVVSGVYSLDYQVKVLQDLSDAINYFIRILPLLNSFSADSFIEFLKELKQYGVDGVEAFINTFKNSERLISEGIATMFSYVSNEVQHKSELMEGLGRIMVSYMRNGITSQDAERNMRDALTDLINSAKNGVRTDNMEEVGRFAVEGFCRGIRNNLGSAEEAGRDLGYAAYDAARRELEVRSPSRKMAEIGSYAGEGFVLGFSDWLKAAADTGEDLGDSAVDSLRESINKIGREFQNEEEFNPTITPILDLSNLENGAKQIGGLLDINTPVQLAANAGMSFSGGLNGLLSNIQASIPDNSNDDVVASINSLRDDLNSLRSVVGNLQVVMDTGELVGIIADPIDQQLGFNSVLNSRGVRR